MFSNHKRKCVSERWRAPALRLEVLEDRTVPSTLTLGTMGDSITATYRGTFQGSRGDRSWVDQFQALRSEDAIQIFNVAHGGDTTTSLLNRGQHRAVAQLVSDGLVQNAVLIIGANDEQQFWNQIRNGNYTPFINTVTANIQQALTTVAQAGDVNLVLADLPDIGVTPLWRSTHSQADLQKLTEAVTQVNQVIQSAAADNGIPVLDLFAVGKLLQQGSFTMGDVEVTQFFAPDYFHPGTVLQGLLGNTVLAALNIAYGQDVDAVRLSDQEILDEAGIDHPPEETYFDVTPFVIYNGGGPHPHHPPAELARAVLPSTPQLAESASHSMAATLAFSPDPFVEDQGSVTIGSLARQDLDVETQSIKTSEVLKTSEVFQTLLPEEIAQLPSGASAASLR
jgi:lysophospholipase L1-like esterase